MDPHLLHFVPNLRCPLSRQKLVVIEPQGLKKLNTAIQEGSIFTFEKELVAQPLQDALVTADGQYVYPVLEGYIAGLLISKAIVAGEKVTMEQGVSFAAEKKLVQGFYDDFGWVKTNEGYNDTLTFEDRRAVSEKYWSRCHLRLNKYLPGGNYLLDVASGSIPNDEYLTFSDRYGQRICMDFSILALKEAAQRLKGKGIFILGDMTAIPIADSCIDSVISMHTVYHIPQQEQTKAVGESYRVLKPGGKSVIVYGWKKPALMKFAFATWRPLLKFYKFLRGRKNKSQKLETGSRPELFLQQQGYDWFLKEIRKPYNARLEVYSGISRSFSNTFIQEKAFGRKLSSFIYWLESQFPYVFGRWGQYPVFLLTKKEEREKPDRAPAGRAPERHSTRRVGKTVS